MQHHILAVQDSQLAHTALQIRCAAGEPPSADILFEATEAGLTAQESHLRKLLGATQAKLSSENIWNARQDLFDSPTNATVLAKITLLPTNIAKTLDSLKTIGDSRNATWRIVLQATGIGTLRLEAVPTQLSASIEQLRGELQSRGGALVVLRRPAELYSTDAWADPGDTAPLMRAVKHQLDPKNALNPGRFVGGI